jgi:RNA-binding protein
MDNAFKKILKAKAHHLKPVILLGTKGLTTAVLDETNIALTTHELIKVKIKGVEKEDKIATAIEICEKLRAELVQIIGNVAVVYRKKED